MNKTNPSQGNAKRAAKSLKQLRGNIIRTLFKKELLELFRDKKTVIVMLFLPLLVYPLMGLMMAGIMSAVSATGETTTLYLAANRIDPALWELMEEQSDRISLLPEMKDPEEAVNTGLADAALVREEKNGQILYTVYYRSADGDSSEVTSMLGDSIKQYGRQLSEERLREAGLPVEETLDPVVFTRTDLSTDMDFVGFALGGSIPMMLMIFVMTGAFYPAVDMTSGERERGTMELLLTMPVTNLELIMSKFLAVAMIAVASAVINIAGIGAFMFSVGSMMTALEGGTEAMEFTSFLPVIGILLLCVIAFALFISAVIMCICAFAKSFKEANNYITPLMFGVMFGSIITFMPNLSLNATTALIPVVNVALLIRETITFQYNLLPIMLVLLTNVIYAFLAIYILSRIYSSESVLFGEGGASVKFFESRRNLKHGALPTMQEALFLFLVVLVLLFYVSALTGMANQRLGTLLLQGLFAALPLAACWYIKGSFREVFSLKAPTAKGLLSGIALIAGGTCLAQLSSLYLSRLLPQSMENVSATFESLLSDMQFGPTLLMIAVAPAICEEILFRGYFLTAAKHTWKMRGAVLFTGLLFGIFHMSLIRFVPTFVLGILLTYAAYTTGSIFVPMLMHFLNNAFAVLLMYFGDRIPGLEGGTYSAGWQVALAVIAVCGIAGGGYISSLNRR